MIFLLLITSSHAEEPTPEPAVQEAIVPQEPIMTRRSMTGATLSILGVAGIVAGGIVGGQATAHLERLQTHEYSTRAEFEREREVYARERIAYYGLVGAGIGSFSVGQTLIIVDNVGPAVPLLGWDAFMLGVSGRF